MNTNPLTNVKGIPLVVSILNAKINQLKEIPLVIAIDGHSSSGKSTLARDLAAILELRHLDSGAMYRAVTLYILDHDVDLDKPDQLEAALAAINIDLRPIGDQMRTFLNGRDVEEAIRSPRIASFVSEVSTKSAVRRFLVDQQQLLGRQKRVVMDGRDIGTVVFPKAEVKFFLTASMKVRCKRRLAELLSKGIDTDLDAVRENLQKRDYIDSHRKDSPLKQAEDAFVLDTSDMDRNQQATAALEYILKRLLF